MSNKPYATDMFHGMTFQQILFQMASKGLFWNPALIALIVTDALVGDWTWVSYTLIAFFTLRFFTTCYLAGWVAKQSPDRNITKEARR